MPRDVFEGSGEGGGGEEDGGVTPSAWTAYPLANGWKLYNTDNAGDGYGNAAYRINGDTVELRGLLDGDTGSGHLAALPVEARPTIKRRLWLQTQSDPQLVACDMNPSGILAQPNGTPMYRDPFLILDGAWYALTDD